MLTLQTRNLGNLRVMGCLGGCLHSLSALVPNVLRHDPIMFSVGLLNDVV